MFRGSPGRREIDQRRFTREASRVQVQYPPPSRREGYSADGSLRIEPGSSATGPGAPVVTTFAAVEVIATRPGCTAAVARSARLPPSASSRPTTAVPPGASPWRSRALWAYLRGSTPPSCASLAAVGQTIRPGRQLSPTSIARGSTMMPLFAAVPPHDRRRPPGAVPNRARAPQSSGAGGCGGAQCRRETGSPGAARRRCCSCEASRGSVRLFKILENQPIPT